MDKYLGTIKKNSGQLEGDRGSNKDHCLFGSFTF